MSNVKSANQLLQAGGNLWQKRKQRKERQLERLQERQLERHIKNPQKEKQLDIKLRLESRLLEREKNRLEKKQWLAAKEWEQDQLDLVNQAVTCLNRDLGRVTFRGFFFL